MNTTQCPQPGLEPGPLNPDSSALTMTPSSYDTLHGTMNRFGLTKKVKKNNWCDKPCIFIHLSAYDSKFKKCLSLHEIFVWNKWRRAFKGSSPVNVVMGSMLSGFSILLKEHYLNSLFSKALLVLNYLFHSYVKKRKKEKTAKIYTIIVYICE